jgi:hypothetical protein
MFMKLRYLLRIGPGWEVTDIGGVPGRDFGPNWISGLVYYLYRLWWCRDDYVRVEYFFEYIHFIPVGHICVPVEE